MLEQTLSTGSTKRFGACVDVRLSKRVSRCQALSRPVPSQTVQTQPTGLITHKEKDFWNGKHLSFCRESAVDAQRERAHIRVIAPTEETA